VAHENRNCRWGGANSPLSAFDLNAFKHFLLMNGDFSGRRNADAHLMKPVYLLDADGDLIANEQSLAHVSGQNQQGSNSTSRDAKKRLGAAQCTAPRRAEILKRVPRPTSTPTS
jgi:hypothetical protein